MIAVALREDRARREAARVDGVGRREAPDREEPACGPRAAPATEGLARFVGICETDDSASPHSGQKRADSGIPKPHLGHGVKANEF